MVETLGEHIEDLSLEPQDEMDVLSDASTQREDLLAEIDTREEVKELAKTTKGRALLRSICLDEDGVFILPEDHNLTMWMRIEYLYQGEPIMVNGTHAEYRGGTKGKSYYPLGDPENRITIGTGTRIEEIPPGRRPIVIPQLMETTPLSTNFSKKVTDSPVRDYLHDLYQQGDDLDRQLLDSSRYTAEELEPSEVAQIEALLRADGLFDGLESRGWDKGMALIHLSDNPQVLLWMLKAESGQVVRMRTYLVSSGRRGIGTGENQTPSGVAKLRFNYATMATGGGFMYDEKDSFDYMPVGTVFMNQRVNHPRIQSTTGSYTKAHPAVMTTRIMKLHGQEEGNDHMTGYYGHGTNREQRLGGRASAGCIRMSNLDVLELTRILPEEGVLIDILTERESLRASQILPKI
jgi:hypothetical protein